MTTRLPSVLVWNIPMPRQAHHPPCYVMPCQLQLSIHTGIRLLSEYSMVQPDYEAAQRAGREHPNTKASAPPSIVCSVTSSATFVRQHCLSTAGGGRRLTLHRLMPDAGGIVVHSHSTLGAVLADQKAWLFHLQLTPGDALQAALERQDLSCVHLAHHELHSALLIQH